MEAYAASQREIRYAALGDSYSIGEGATPEQSWPALLTRHLNAQGTAIKLVANPSVTGWTTQQAIDYELPVLREARADFVTLLVGVNDWVQGVSSADFRHKLSYLIEQILSALPKKNRLLLVTIPDFSVTPEGPKYARGRDIAKGIASFNDIITEEARKRSLRVADIFPASQRMHDNPSLVAADGLHPSARAYAQWAEIILPSAWAILQK